MLEQKVQELTSAIERLTAVLATTAITKPSVSEPEPEKAVKPKLEPEKAVKPVPPPVVEDVDDAGDDDTGNDDTSDDDTSDDDTDDTGDDDSEVNVTLELLRETAARMLQTETGGNTLAGFLKEIKAAKISQVPQDKYAWLYKAMRAALEA